MLRQLPDISDPRVLVAALTRDDAAVYRLSDERAIVATVDFFTPIVDTAHTFGAIAAANAFSDLYAMGATPLLALNIVAWPRDPEMLDLLAETVRGAVQVVKEAGVFILGGHSIDDKEPKFGLVAIGDVHPARLITNAGARPGDRLVLTKPIGTGILSTALKLQLITEQDMQDAVRSMITLNAGGARAMATAAPGVHAATDVTGFGLIGHLHTMAHSSRVGARVFANRLPAFEGVVSLIEQQAVPGGTTRNREAADAYTRWTPQVAETTRILVCDAQTSGGLLIAVDPAHATILQRALRQEGSLAAAVIGEVVEGDGRIEVLHD